jgi:hypothetical protein
MKAYAQFLWPVGLVIGVVSLGFVLVIAAWMVPTA